VTRVQAAGVSDPLKVIAAGPLGLGEDDTLRAGAEFDAAEDPLVCFRSIASALEFTLHAKVAGGTGVFSFEFCRPVPPYTTPYGQCNPSDTLALDPGTNDGEGAVSIECHGEHLVKITFTPDADQSGTIVFVDGSQR
jgi:hypothetical protein